MTTMMQDPPRIADIWEFEDDAKTFAVAPLGSHLQEAPETAWVWCFRCERASQLAAIRGGSCGYGDCDAGALDFWQWDAYCAFVGDSVVPANGVHYSLAQGE